jgi:hypothetical protein
MLTEMDDDDDDAGIEARLHLKQQEVAQVAQQSQEQMQLQDELKR